MFEQLFHYCITWIELNVEQGNQILAKPQSKFIKKGDKKSIKSELKGNGAAGY